MQHLERSLRHLENWAMLLVATALFSMMLITVINVVLRYIFNAPLVWSYEVISDYLLAISFFLALSYTLREHGHIALDSVIRRIQSPHARSAIGLVCDLFALALFLGICYEGSLTTHSSWANDYSLPGAIPLPAWPAYIMIPIGSGLISIRLICQIVIHTLDLRARQFRTQPATDK